VSDPPSLSPEFALVVSPPGPGRPSAIAVHGELDSGTCPELMEAVRSVLAGPPGARLTLDLSQMTFVDSAGTRALILIEREAREGGVALEVRPPAEQVTELLRTAGVVDRVRLASGTGSLRRRFLDRVELELPREPRSPARARAEVREELRGCEEAVLASVVLLTSELVTNAVVHPRSAGQTPIALRIISYEDGVRIEVEDAGEGFEYVVSDLPEGERGRGLFLVDSFSSRWGRERVEGEAGARFRVWFETDWPPREADRAA
jgi:anti-anti-sigma factor